VDGMSQEFVTPLGMEEEPMKGVKGYLVSGSSNHKRTPPSHGWMQAFDERAHFLGY